MRFSYNSLCICESLTISRSSDFSFSVFNFPFSIGQTILSNKNKYEFLKWDCELGDCVMFDMRTLHGTLSSLIPRKTLSRYTLRVAKENTKIDYVGDWTSYSYRKAMQDAGYKNGDNLGGNMFPQLWPR